MMSKPNIKDHLKVTEFDGLKKYSINEDTINKYALPFSQIKAVEKIIELNNSSKVYFKEDWLHLLRIIYFYNTYEGKHNIGKTPCSSQIIELHFAYDLLLRLDNFEDLEKRIEETGDFSRRFFDGTTSRSNRASKYYLAGRGRANYFYKEQSFRAMRIFLNHYQNFRRKFHKTIWKWYVEDGLTMEAIGKKYKTKKGVKKPVTRTAIFYIINYYRHALLRHMTLYPHLYDIELDDLTEEMQSYTIDDYFKDNKCYTPDYN